MDEISVLRLNTYYKLHDLNTIHCILDGILRDPANLVMSTDLQGLLFWYRFLIIKDLKLMCQYHGIYHSCVNKDALVKLLLGHTCNSKCKGIVYVFKSLPTARRYVLAHFMPESQESSSLRTNPPGVNITPVAAVLTSTDSHNNDVDDTDLMGHLDPLDDAQKLTIISDWQNKVNTENLRFCICAVCAKKLVISMTVLVDGNLIDLSLLRNDLLPLALAPTQYNFHVYKRALLNPKGLRNLDMVGLMRICVKCNTSLRNGNMPKFALANWLYYGLGNLPHSVKEAFESSTIFDRMLTSRARTNNICCRFNIGGNSAATVTGNSAEKADILSNARKGLRGNVMVAPLDVVRMNEVLPPSSSTIRDTMCAVFVGNCVPSRTTINKFSPILVRKSRVKTIIQFLLSFNPYYQPTQDFQFSQYNLDSLFNTVEEEGVPASVTIGHLPMNDAIAVSASDYTPRNEDDAGPLDPVADKILMENVGYTDGDDTPASYRAMKIMALGHCLQGRPFLASGKGNRPVPDFRNPAIMTWLFPHLDPWGIGGFYHPRRMVKISMEEQVSHLLMVDDSPFERDTEFAFVFYNVIRKAAVTKSLRFTVPFKTHKRIIADLLRVDPVILAHLNRECTRDALYRPVNEEEQLAFRLLASLGTIARHIPGSDGYKLNLRNEIRSLIYYRSTPTLFVTINPSDVDSPIVRLYSGESVNLEDLSRGEGLDSWRRRLLAAKNPAACALYFDLMIKRFVDVILRYGRNEPGLYGYCTAYYGTVEAQGKGTLHCHMLIWLKGHLSPLSLREKIASSPVYKQKMFEWLESIIHCELPSDSRLPAKVQTDQRSRSKDLGNPHPGTQIPRQLRTYHSNLDTFWTDYRGDLTLLLNEYSWHIHQATCWKYLKRKQERTDANCRMGMDGITHLETHLDPETASIVVRRHHPMIAPYSDVVVYLMRCNMDIKFIGSGDAAKAFVYYVTDYITKPSLSVHAGMSALSYVVTKVRDKLVTSTDDADNNAATAMGAVITAVNSMMGRHEISHPQVMSYLVGGGDHYTSEQFSTLHWGAISRYVISKWMQFDSEAEQDVQIQVYLNDQEVTASSQLLDYIYRTTSNEINSLCLYDFVSLVAKVKCSSRDVEKNLAILSNVGFTSWSHPQRATHYLKLRKTPFIPVILGLSIQNPQTSAQAKHSWARDILVLFKPWRDPLDLKHAHQDWVTAYDEFECNIKE